MGDDDEILLELTKKHLNIGLRGVPVGTCRTSFVTPEQGVHYCGYPIKDLVTRMQEITGVQLRKTLSRAVASIYDSGRLDVEYQKNGFQVKRVTLNTQKHRDSIVASDQKKMFKDILKVGVKGKGRIQLKDMERETRISYKDCRLFASGERSAFKRDISERYDNHIALSVFLARHISSTEWARDKIADAGITEIKGMENLISILLVIYQDYNTRQIKEESISKKIVGLEFCISTIWLPMYNCWSSFRKSWIAVFESIFFPSLLSI